MSAYRDRPRLYAENPDELALLNYSAGARAQFSTDLRALLAEERKWPPEAVVGFWVASGVAGWQIIILAAKAFMAGVHTIGGWMR